jgi:hypothetical protein
MMTRLSFHDVKLLSAYLDGELRQAECARLKARLQSDAVLAGMLDELHQSRHLLQQTPRRRAPRSFVLTPKMAGIRAPIPRAVPVLSWASAISTLILLVTFAGSMLPRMASAPKMAPYGLGGGGGYGGGEPVDKGGPELTAPPASIPDDNTALTSTPEFTALMGIEPTTVPENTPALDARAADLPAVSDDTSDVSDTPFTISSLQIILIFLVLLLGGAAYLVSWLTDRTFQRKLRR